MTTTATSPVITARPDDLEHRGRDRAPRMLATVLVVVVLVGLNLANHILGWESMWLGPVGAVVLLWFARLSGLSWKQLGMAKENVKKGLAWGGGVIGAVALVYLVGVLLPLTRTAFLDARYHLPPAEVLFTAFVIIPIGTILLEEVAFRGVLWGFLSRHARMWQVALGSALLFGLWHVLPASASTAANPAVAAIFVGAGIWAHYASIVGTVLFTAVGGLVAGELRRRSGSVLASVGMHWATNALGVLFGLVAWALI